MKMWSTKLLPVALAICKSMFFAPGMHIFVRLLQQFLHFSQDMIFQTIVGLYNWVNQGAKWGKGHHQLRGAIPNIIYCVMVLHRLGKTCYFDFVVVLPHPFLYYITLIPYYLLRDGVMQVE